jgi:hypothetical protein
MSREGDLGESNILTEVIFDGMSLPPFKPLRKDVEGRLNAIRNLKTRPDDVLLAIYPKSGLSYASFLLHTKDSKLFCIM